jgi:hypothetical protein
MSGNLPRLSYLPDGKSELLPEWSYFFLRLGYQLATVSNGSYRVVIGLAIPTRAFACGLVAAGIVLAKAGSETRIDTMRLQHIRSLKPGTPVYVRTDNNRRFRGFFNCLKDFQGKEYVSIHTAKSEERCYPLERYASRITVSERDVSLPKHQQSGYLLEAPGKFLQCCLGKKLAQRHILDSSFEALLAGKKTVIKQEVSEIPFVCRTSKSTGVSGCLQEILRVRQFSGANKAYRTQCVSSSDTTQSKK